MVVSNVTLRQGKPFATVWIDGRCYVVPVTEPTERSIRVTVAALQAAGNLELYAADSETCAAPRVADRVRARPLRAALFAGVLALVLTRRRVK